MTLVSHFLRVSQFVFQIHRAQSWRSHTSNRICDFRPAQQPKFPVNNAARRAKYSPSSESITVQESSMQDTSDNLTNKKPRHKPARPQDSFEACGVPLILVDELASMGITKPFPIQSATLPDAFSGRDVLGRGRTGSGKTLAFALPVLTRLAGGKSKSKRPRAVILAPTRELANQINETVEPLADMLGLRTVTVYGGVSPVPQLNALRRGVDIVVACPGRLLDHFRTGNLMFDDVQVTVIDEADHMADLGFLPDVRTIMDETPRESQRLLFSATLDRDVNVLVRNYLHDPLTHSVDSDHIESADEMSHRVLQVDSGDRVAVIAELAGAPSKTIIFTRTRHGAQKLAEQLARAGVAAVDLHGSLSQAARARNLEVFSSGRASTLVATDIAARGIHVDDVGLVIHADPPAEHKAYLHRSGRTARAGATGTVVTMMTGAQTKAVRELTRKAGIKPTTNRVKPGDPLLAEIAPGERVFRTIAPAAKGQRGERAERRQSGKYGEQSERPRNSKSKYRPGSKPRDERPTRGERPARDDGRPSRENGYTRTSNSDRPRSDRPASERRTETRYATTAGGKGRNRGPNRGESDRPGGTGGRPKGSHAKPAGGYSKAGRSRQTVGSGASKSGR